MFVKLKNGYIYKLKSSETEDIMGSLLEQDEIYRFYKFSDEIVKFKKSKVAETIVNMKDIGYMLVNKETYVRDDEPGYLRDIKYTMEQDNTPADITYPGKDLAEREFREWIPKSDGEKRFKRTIQNLEKKYS